MNATQKLEIFLQGQVAKAEQNAAEFTEEFRKNPVDALLWVGRTFQYVGRKVIAQAMLNQMMSGASPADVVELLVEDLNLARDQKKTGSVGQDQLAESKVNAMAEILNKALECAEQYKNETADECKNK